MITLLLSLFLTIPSGFGGQPVNVATSNQTSIVLATCTPFKTAVPCSSRISSNDKYMIWHAVYGRPITGTKYSAHIEVRGPKGTHRGYASNVSQAANIFKKAGWDVYWRYGDCLYIKVIHGCTFRIVPGNTFSLVYKGKEVKRFW